MTKVCTKCDVEKPLEEFYKAPRGKLGRKSQCKECLRGESTPYVREWRKNNDRQPHDQAYAKKNPEAKRASQKRWEQKNRLVVNAYASARRARLNGAKTNNNLSEEIRIIFTLMPFCGACGTTEKLSLDHVVALVSGGSNTLDNFQVLCISHNSSKGRKTIDYRTPEICKALGIDYVSV